VTTHELARVLLAAPDRPAVVEVDLGGDLHDVPLTVLVVSEDEIEYMQLDPAKFSPGDVIIMTEVV
jgi:hypothetical protein